MISTGRYVFLLLLIGTVYAIGVFNPLMENDSAQFGVMSMRMYQENDYVNLIKGTEEYLDKPHMHYWLAAASYHVFGLHDWAYKIPAILLTLLAAISCFGLATLFYGRKTGLLAALIFLTAQTIFLANNDVRTDAVLTGFSMFSIWQLVAYVEKQKLVNIILGSTAAALAFSTKGQIALVVIGLCLLCHLWYTKKWKVVLSWKVLVGLVFFGLCIAPMLYAYYLQFDLHPEKVIRGKANRSGIFFIFWEQSFERLSGEGVGKNSNDYFFFFHTLLWAMLPWTFVLIGALVTRIKFFSGIKFRYQPKFEFLTLGGFVLVFLLISFAQFKLPHYLNVLIPVLAVLCASYLYGLHKEDNQKALGILLKLHVFMAVLISMLALVLLFYVFGSPSASVMVCALFLLFSLVFFIIKKDRLLSKIIMVTVLTAVLVNFTLNAHFYPKLLQYQAGYKASFVIAEENIPKNRVYKVSEGHTWALDFYNQRPTPVISLDEVKKEKKPLWLFVSESELEMLKTHGVSASEAKKIPNYKVSRLQLKFLNPKKREASLGYKYLVKVGG